jgi:hypothetical protein
MRLTKDSKRKDKETFKLSFKLLLSRVQRKWKDIPFRTEILCNYRAQKRQYLWKAFLSWASLNRILKNATLLFVAIQGPQVLAFSGLHHGYSLTSYLTNNPGSTGEGEHEEGSLLFGVRPRCDTHFLLLPFMGENHSQGPTQPRGSEKWSCWLSSCFPGWLNTGDPSAPILVDSQLALIAHVPGVSFTPKLSLPQHPTIQVSKTT